MEYEWGRIRREWYAKEWNIKEVEYVGGGIRIKGNAKGVETIRCSLYDMAAFG